MAFLGKPCRWHDEQFTLAEFSEYIARDVIAHIELAAETRVKTPVISNNDEDSELESDDGAQPRRPRVEAELVDMGGGDGADVDADMEEDVGVQDSSRFPLTDIPTRLALCLQQPHLASLDSKTRKSQADMDLKAVDQTYDTVLQQDFRMDPSETVLAQHGFGNECPAMLALQKSTIDLAT